MRELTDAEHELVGMYAAQKITETDDWETEEVGYDPALKDAEPDLVLKSGRRLSIVVHVKVFDHDPE